MGRSQLNTPDHTGKGPLVLHIEEVLLDALDCLEAGVLIVSLDGRVVHVNSSLERILGYRSEEMIGSMCFDLIEADYEGIVRENLNRRKQGKSAFYTIYVRHRAGHGFPVSVAANPLRDKEGKIYAAVVTVIPLNCSQDLVCYAQGQQTTPVSLTSPSEKDRLGCSNLKLHPATLKCSVGDETFELSPILFRLLTYFVKNQNKLITRKDILENVWLDSSLNDRLLDGHILKLRKVLKSFQGELRTVYGEGYILQPSAVSSED